MSASVLPPTLTDRLQWRIAAVAAAAKVEAARAVAIVSVGNLDWGELGLILEG